MDYKIFNKNSSSSCEIKESRISDDVTELDVRLDLEASSSPESFGFSFEIPCDDIYSFWSPALGEKRYLRPNWMPAETKSRFASWLPLSQCVSVSGKNRLTVCCSDCHTPMNIKMGIVEERATVVVTVEFFSSAVAPLKEYKATVRLDWSGCDYYGALYSAIAWLEGDCGYTPAEVPAAAKLPMYSAWYSFHQNIDVEKIVEQCRLAKKLGMETVIVDDGWQTDDSSRGYAYCGDWRVAPSKVKDMAKFVDAVHGTGMKFMIWYSVPYIGPKTQAFERFKTMLLDGKREKPWYHLDPRFKEVRDYLVGIYTDAVKKWDIDGLKLDFIDSFAIRPDCEVYDERRDCSSLEDSLYKLMTEITTAVKAIKPDFLFEFRQSYIGPAVKMFGNMLRVADCPNDASRNRKGIADLRFTSGKTPVHSDMLMWSPTDSVECAATQVISSLFGVVQVSVLLDKIPEEHRKMLKFYLDFAVKNQSVLLDGEFFALTPDCGYTLAGAFDSGKEICVYYCNIVYSCQRRLGEYVFCNCHGEGGIYLDMKQGGCFKLEIFNCMGEKLSEEQRELCGLCSIPVPFAGMAKLSRI